MASNYYTMKDGSLYMHHDESRPRNTFYNTFTNSSINVILNTKPGIIKSFRTLNYEGSQAKINAGENVLLTFPGSGQPATNYDDQEYHNLSAQLGWYVPNKIQYYEDGIETDQDTGYITDFIGKEGKWFANMNKFIDTTL